MTTCYILKKTKSDDVMENLPIYGSGAFFACICSVFFLPYKGILYGNTTSGTLLGYQLLGFVAVRFNYLILGFNMDYFNFMDVLLQHEKIQILENIKGGVSSWIRCYN